MVLITLDTLSYIVLATTLSCSYFYLHFMDDETEA